MAAAHIILFRKILCDIIIGAQEALLIYKVYNVCQVQHHNIYFMIGIALTRNI